MFATATRKKLRFGSSRGEIDCEMLWTVPLRSKDAFNLNDIAERANAQLESTAKTNFVPAATKRNPEQKQAALRLDIVKHVIRVKMDEEEKAMEAAVAREERAKLLDALAEKEDAEIKGLSKAEILKRLKKIEETNEEE